MGDSAPNQDGGAKPKYARRVRRVPKLRRRVSPGEAPGSVVADPEAPKPVVSRTLYSPEQIEELHNLKAADLSAEIPPNCKLWVNVDGLGDAEVVKNIGAKFDLHSLALEDVVNTHQRSKVELYTEFLFIVARMPLTGHGVETEQVSIFMKKNGLITFQELAGGDVFESVRDRMRRGKGKIREKGADYLCYALLDAIIDSYFPLLEQYSDRIEHLEEQSLNGDTKKLMTELHSIKQDLVIIRRAIWPLREAMNQLIRDCEGFFREETRLYLRDCYDHTVQLMDIVETYRELCSDLRDVALSTMSHKMNEVMKVLTIMSSIFIPLTFIAGVYGMNFDPESSPYNMPELKAYYGYPISLGMMLLVAIALLIFFKKKKWL